MEQIQVRWVVSDITVRKIDDVHVQVGAEFGILQEMAEFFTFFVPGYQFMPSFKNKVWDGKVRLLNTMSGAIYGGLVPYILSFAQDRDYTVEVESSAQPMQEIDETGVLQFIETLGLPFPPKDYQLKALLHGLRARRTLLLSPTASGKSMIAHLFTECHRSKPTLIVVPTKGLVTQMRSDLISYGADERDIQIIMGGHSKIVEARIVISTWQSIFELPKAWFKDFRMIIGDEAHLFKANSLLKVMSKLVNCPIRIGMTGTLDGTKTHKLVLEGLFGTSFEVENTANLIKDGHLSKFRVRATILEHSAAVKAAHAKSRPTYAEELRFLIRHGPRNQFISDLALALKGNTIVLFAIIEHGKELHRIIQSKAVAGRKVFLIYGATDAEARDQVRHIVEKESDAIIIASYGTFSTGVNIKNLTNYIPASPAKGRIRVLQSIGRILRKLEGKEMSTMYDIGDDITWKSRTNHTFSHLKERLLIYGKEDFEVKIFRRPIGDG